ncbi:MAG: dienelactone hydrolase family protein [Ilumatobacteraceae bacterium]
MLEWVHVAKPDGAGPFPVIVFFHHGPGFDEGSKQLVQMVAERGYYVATIDRYHRIEPWVTFDMSTMRQPNNPERERMMQMVFGTTDDQVEEDVSALLHELRSEPSARADGPMGCIGYCIGARSVLRTMAHHPHVFLAGVCLHPSFCTTDATDSPHLAVASLPGHLYIGFGADDKMQPVEMNWPLIAAVEQLGDRGIVEIHPHADHGFAVPGAPAYQEAAASRSYAQAFATFATAL